MAPQRTWMRSKKKPHPIIVTADVPAKMVLTVTASATSTPLSWKLATA